MLYKGVSGLVDKLKVSSSSLIKGVGAGDNTLLLIPYTDIFVVSSSKVVMTDSLLPSFEKLMEVANSVSVLVIS